MKPRVPESVERRRPQVNLNLLGEVKTRSAKATRGCAALLGRLLVNLVLLAVVVVRLS